MTGPLYSHASNVVDAEVGDELVVLDVNSGGTFALNEVAATIWRGLAQPMSFEELRELLLATYDVPHDQCTRELQQLLDDLTEKGLVRTSD